MRFTMVRQEHIWMLGNKLFSELGVVIAWNLWRLRRAAKCSCKDERVFHTAGREVKASS